MIRSPQGQGRLPTISPWHPCLVPARGSRFQPTLVPPPSRRRRGPAPAHPGKRAAIPAHRFLAPQFPVCSFLGLQLRKLGAKIRRLLPDVQPVEEGLRGFQPNAEPPGDLFFFGALMSFHLVVARDHLRAALAEPRDVQNTLHGRVFALRAKLAHQLVQPHDADLRIFQRLEVQQILEFFFVLFLRFFLLVDGYLLSRIFQHVRNVFHSRFAGLAMLRHQAPAQLVDLCRRPLLYLDFPCGLQDQCLLRFQIFGHPGWPRCCLPCLCFGLRRGGAAGGSPPLPARTLRSFTTLLVCFASASLKKCPPCVLATK